MKKIFLSFVLCLISITAFCQTTEHLKFMGIPINGTPYAFTQKMAAKGFKHYPSEDTDGYNLYKGKFAGYNDCIIEAMKFNNTVYAIAISIPINTNNTWNGIKSAYLKIRNNIYNKYNIINVDTNEYFDKPYYEGDGYELTAIFAEACHFTTIFTVDNNASQIITRIGDASSIYLFYLDGINYQRYDDYKKNQLSSDL